jgi:putative component of membrane protein insertase Oxa1/YidC/SpoIIIJ protein YidD
MKFVLLLTIKAYWKLIPNRLRRPCIYKTSCSNYVYLETHSGGFLNGIKALNLRFKTCRHGFEVFVNPIDGTKQILLTNGEILKEEVIAERFTSGNTY